MEEGKEGVIMTYLVTDAFGCALIRMLNLQRVELGQLEAYEMYAPGVVMTFILKE